MGALDAPVTWDRRRLLVVLGLVTAAGLALLVGLLLAVYFAIAGATSTGRHPAQETLVRRTGSAVTAGRGHRDAVAAAAMPTVAADAAQPAPPAALPALALDIPGSSTIGPADVPSGFPHTPQGAIGQLAAIEQVVLQSMSMQQTVAVHANWALPGAPGVAQWPLTRDVQAFLGSAQMGSTLDPASTVVVTPGGAQVKGTDGPDWVLACVLITVHATITQDAQMGYGYCERMQWHADRWMIAPGAAAAPAPSTWPGSDASRTAGWRTWAGAGGGED